MTAAILVGLAFTAALAWDASERHYDSCVSDAVTRTPLNRPGVRGEFQRFTGDTQRRRERAVKGCSRLPW